MFGGSVSAMRCQEPIAFHGLTDLGPKGRGMIACD